MQALKVNSSDNGATTWLRSQIKFVKFDIQYVGSKNKKNVKVWKSNRSRIAMANTAGQRICAK
jgi:hypothetical protein